MYDEYGYPLVDPDLCVCAECFADDGLKAYVQAHANSKECSFCGAVSDEEIAAPLDELVAHMRSCLARDYDDPDSAGMSYETREGGYQGKVWDTEELLWDLGFELPNDRENQLLGAICHGLGDHLWCDRYLYALGPDEALAYSWRTFCDLVKHQNRYFFTQRVEDSDERELLSPAELLKVIVDYAETAGLIKNVPKGRDYYRARLQPPGEKLSKPSQLGPPPPAKAAQNRMSPAGIVMMYVSEDAETAVAETAVAAGTYAVGEFRTSRDITILDLAELPPVTGLFAELPDSLEYDPRKISLFLHRVSRDMSRPIARDDRIHIEYVPTQVVTEYVRTAGIADGTKIDGIRYRSSRKHDGFSLVLFADEGNVAGAWTKDYPKLKSDEWLQLSGPVTEQSVELEALVPEIESSTGEDE